jgi:hypothetical protein
MGFSQTDLGARPRRRIRDSLHGDRKLSKLPNPLWRKSGVAPLVIRTRIYIMMAKCAK